MSSISAPSLSTTTNSSTVVIAIAIGVPLGGLLLIILTVAVAVLLWSRSQNPQLQGLPGDASKRSDVELGLVSQSHAVSIEYYGSTDLEAVAQASQTPNPYFNSAIAQAPGSVAAGVAQSAVLRHDWRL